MASNNIINISTTKPKLSVIGFEDPGGLKLKSPMTAPASAPKKSVNFGPGLELLMNPKKANASPKADINMSDLDALENKINKTAGLSKADLTKKIFSTTQITKQKKATRMRRHLL